MSKINNSLVRNTVAQEKVSAKGMHRRAQPAISADWSAFALDNGKQMQLEEIVRSFVPSEAFKDLFNSKNQILLGSRGSGKTTWVRMLAHDHVMYASRIAEPRMQYAREALSRNLIGIYVPASAAFSGALKNKDWSSEKEAEEQFVWRLNLHCCAALTHIIESCAERFLTEEYTKLKAVADVCKKLSFDWTQGKRTCNTIGELRSLLTEIELSHQAALRAHRVRHGGRSGEIAPLDFFDNDALLPLRHAIEIIKNIIHIPDSAVWMVCVDEVEYLTVLHHRILNTIMRASSGNIVLKLATMPFAHLTLATNVEDPIREGHDFQYVVVNQDPVDSRGVSVDGGFMRFAQDIFRHRFANRNIDLDGISLSRLLGSSPLFIDTQKNEAAFMEQLRKYGNTSTIERAERLKGTKKFGSEIYRKLAGAITLRTALDEKKGNSKLTVYSGEQMVVRCCDGNPRRLVRVINLLVQRAVRLDGKIHLPIDPAIQNEVLEETARDVLARTPSEPPFGDLTAKYINAIGAYMGWLFSSSQRRLGSDQVTSVTIKAADGEDAQHFIKQAIQLSLMTPSNNVPMKTPDQVCEGDFHLAFLFAPLFKILPRRNEVVRLPKVLMHAREIQTKRIIVNQGILDLQ
ncbi:hypothetical protein [Rhodoferax sp.]|uniref:ORC-CDC6 family AAA ATPase n=1 Tax=Rhodoferax sp. TaxID=50421 RepID=UPI0025E872A9|nr:hypothetical protein [Rhodoferax sp.]MCM2296602.1 hypothetical protein [Rhodoferax sp.]